MTRQQSNSSTLATTHETATSQSKRGVSQFENLSKRGKKKGQPPPGQIEITDEVGESFFPEFRSSAIPDRYARIAARSIDGRTALEVLSENGLTGRNSYGSTRTAYLNKSDRWLLDRYESACEAGGWEARQARLEGIEPVPHLKLNTPRHDRDGDPIKYETPYKAEATPMLAPFTWEMGLTLVNRYCPKPVRETYGERWEATGAAPDDVDEGFWDFVEAHREVPLVIGEGWKKGCSVSVRGYPTLSLRGVDCFFKRRLNRYDVSIPHEVCDRLVTEGRQIVIAFDKDDKPQTVKRVRAATDRIASWAVKRGCRVSIASWDEEWGKGIDDVLYGFQSRESEEAALGAIERILKNSVLHKTWKRTKRIGEALEKIDALNSLSFDPERATEGEYLPQLPTLSPGAIHVLDATMNSGKTVRIGADWVKSTVAAGWRVLVLSPLNSLGQQTAEDWDLPHIHDYALDRSSQHALWADVSGRGGIVMCYDSLHRLPQWFFERDGKPCPILLVCDEANQGIAHLTGGATLGTRWTEIVGRFAAIARHASQSGAIVLSEDGIPDRAVEYVKSVAMAGHEGENIPVRVFQHRKKSRPWEALCYSGKAQGFRAGLIEEIRTGVKPVLFVTASQAEGERLERVISASLPKKKFIRIDSETNECGEFREFFADPDRWLQENRPDVLSISPSVKSGVSIEGGIDLESAYFGSVWGYFSCGDTDTHLQLLGRYRPPVPRHIFLPPLIQRSADEAIGSSWAVAARLKANARGLAGAIDFDDASIEATAREREIEQASIDYIGKALTASGAQKSIAKIALIERLEKAGHHTWQKTEKLQKELRKKIPKVWKRVQEEIWRDRARFAARLEIDPEVHTKDWAIEQLQKLDVGRELRTKAMKVLWRSDFPGIAFDDERECYEAIYEDYGRMRRGVKMQVMAEMPDKATVSDSAAIASVLKGNIRALHRLPKNAAKAVLLSRLGVLALLDGERYSNSDPRTIEVKDRALKYRHEIRYWLNLNVNDEQTPVEICHKLLRRLGFEIDNKERAGSISEAIFPESSKPTSGADSPKRSGSILMVARPGRRGESRERVYQVVIDLASTRARLLEAYRRKLSEASYEPVSAISNKSSTYIEITDTQPKTPVNTRSEGNLEGVRLMLFEFERDGILAPRR